MEDKELLAKYRSTKDQKYISQLYKRYMHLVFGSAMKYYKNESDAEDAVMDIYEKIVVKTLTSDVTYFKSWLFTVTRNHCLEKLRKIGTHAPKRAQAENMFYEDSFHPDSYDVGKQKDEQVNVLHDCISQLEAMQKTCVDLFYFKKLAYAEIAEQLNLKMGQVRSRIQNGRRNLKICLEKNTPIH